MEDEFDPLKKSINQRKLLIKAGKGDLEKVKCLILKDKVDVNFADEYGNTALHYAVKKSELNVIRWLVKTAEADVIVENNKNETPLDIARDIARDIAEDIAKDNARKVENQEIIDLLVEKITDDAFKVLEDFPNIDKPGPSSTETASKKVDIRIKQTEAKIESCLKSLKKINVIEGGADRENISYPKANILLHCIETFALAGDPSTKDELKKYFSQYYTELDRELFSKARKRLLKTPKKTLTLKDIGKFINGDVKSFFIKLEEYVQYVQDVKELKGLLKRRASELINQGSEEINESSIKDIKLPDCIDEFIEKSKMKEGTKTAVRDFIRGEFYPAVRKTGEGTLQEPSDEDVHSFFVKLLEYVQYLQRVQQLEDQRSGKVEKASGISLLKRLNERKGLKLRTDITLPKLIGFIIDFYPVFHKYSNNNKKVDVLVEKIEKYIKCGHHSKSLRSLLDIIKSLPANCKLGVECLLKHQIKTCLIESDKVDDGVLKILQECVQHTREEGFFLKTFQGKEHNIGEDIPGSYVKEEFEKLLVTSYTEKNKTAELLFNFVVNFYPAFETETNGDLKEFRNLRNNLIHDFPNYGTEEFGKEVYRLRHTLFKYYFAQQVNQALRAIKPDEESEIINRTLRKKLESFKDRHKNVFNKEYLMSTDEAEDSFGHTPSQLLSPEKADHLKKLVDQYLKFMVVIDCAQDSPIHDEEDRNPPSRKKLDALDRREILEGFCRLKRIHKSANENNDNYNNEKKEFEYRLSNEYGVLSHNFNRICSLYIENGTRPFDHSTESEEIPDIITLLKKIKDDYKLSNRVVIDLYNQYLMNKDSFGSDKHRQLLGTNESNHEAIIEKFKNLLPDKIMKTSIGEVELHISRGKVICNMFNTFYNVYYTYTIELNIEEIFNDEVFLDFLVGKEIEHEKVEDLVDSYLKLTFMMNSTGQEMSGIDRKKIFDEFYKLKKLNERSQNNPDEECYKQFSELVVIHGIKKEHFEALYKCCIEKDDDLSDKVGVGKIEKMIKDLKSELKYSNETIVSLCRIAMKGQVSQEEVKNVLKTSNDVEEIVKVLENLIERAKNEVNVQLGDKKWNVNIMKVACDMLEAFGSIVKLNTRNYMIIKKLLKLADYTAPYIVRLITKVESDEIIEKDDLVRLIEILLINKECSYTKSLNELLKLRNSKLKLYEEVCNKIADPRFDIYSMQLIFEESQHVTGILRVLIKRINSDPSDDKLIKLSKKIFELLLDSISKFIGPDYQEALSIVDCALDLINVIKSTSGNVGNYQIFVAKYNFQLKKAKVLNFQGRKLEGKEAKEKNEETAKNYEEAKKKYEEALKILTDILDSSPPHRQSLLASSRKAYTHHLLKEYIHANETWECLWKEILKFVRVETEDYTDIDETYREIERSEKYQWLLALSDDYNKYLDILNIRNSIARNLRFRGWDDENVEYCERALGIYKENYSYKKRFLGPRDKSTILNESWTAHAHIAIAKLKSKQKAKQDALEHNEYALFHNVRLAKIQTDIYGKFHPVIKERIKLIVKNLHHIANINDKLDDKRKKKIDTYVKLHLDDKDKDFSKTSGSVRSVSMETQDWRDRNEGPSQPTSLYFENYWDGSGRGFQKK